VIQWAIGGRIVLGVPLGDSFVTFFDDWKILSVALLPQCYWLNIPHAHTIPHGLIFHSWSRCVRCSRYYCAVTSCHSSSAPLTTCCTCSVPCLPVSCRLHAFTHYPAFHLFPTFILRWVQVPTWFPHSLPWLTWFPGFPPGYSWWIAVPTLHVETTHGCTATYRDTAPFWYHTVPLPWFWDLRYDTPHTILHFTRLFGWISSLFEIDSNTVSLPGYTYRHFPRQLFCCRFWVTRHTADSLRAFTWIRFVSLAVNGGLGAFVPLTQNFSIQLVFDDPTTFGVNSLMPRTYGIRSIADALRTSSSHWCLYWHSLYSPTCFPSHNRWCHWHSPYLLRHCTSAVSHSPTVFVAWPFPSYSVFFIQSCYWPEYSVQAHWAPRYKFGGECGVGMGWVMMWVLERLQLTAEHTSLPPTHFPLRLPCSATYLPTAVLLTRPLQNYWYLIYVYVDFRLPFICRVTLYFVHYGRRVFHIRHCPRNHNYVTPSTDPILRQCDTAATVCNHCWHLRYYRLRLRIWYYGISGRCDHLPLLCRWHCWLCGIHATKAGRIPPCVVDLLPVCWLLHFVVVVTLFRCCCCCCCCCWPCCCCCCCCWYISCCCCWLLLLLLLLTRFLCGVVIDGGVVVDGVVGDGIVVMVIDALIPILYSMVGPIPMPGLPAHLTAMSGQAGSMRLSPSFAFTAFSYLPSATDVN